MTPHIDRLIVKMLPFHEIAMNVHCIHAVTTGYELGASRKEIREVENSVRKDFIV
jgi:endonuclease/exonuclease/phosphatase (EEP) superfamily protein YafD